MRKIKKIMILILTIIVALVTSSCREYHEDRWKPILTVYINHSGPYVCRTWNSSECKNAGAKTGKELAEMNPNYFTIHNGEEACIIFKCRWCGKDEIFKIKNNWAKTLECDCPEEMTKGNNWNCREYCKISILYEP